MAAPSPTTKTISVPYSGGIKRGLLAIVKYKTSRSEAYGSFLYYDTVHAPSRTSIKTHNGELGIGLVSYSNESFSINTVMSGDIEADGSFSVAFLQLNLD